MRNAAMDRNWSIACSIGQIMVGRTTDSFEPLAAFVLELPDLEERMRRWARPRTSEPPGAKVCPEPAELLACVAPKRRPC